MAAFEKVKLQTGEGRSEYIQRRLAEGGTVAEILAEINAPGMYSGPEGKTWSPTVIYAQKTSKASARRAAPVDETDDAVKLDTTGVVVPPQYDEILTVEDVAEIHAEAKQAVRKDMRKKARAQLLAEAKANIQREADLEMRRGRARGDMVDITINLAVYAASLKLDGQEFWHGVTYRVGRDVAKVLQEQMQRSHEHQASISGQKKDYSRERNILINGASGHIQGAEGLR